MDTKIVNCYLCGKKAKQEEAYDTSRNIRVRCPDCQFYEATDRAMRFYILAKSDEGDTKDFLDGVDRKKLADHVRKEYDPVTDNPVLLDTKTIERITNKRSEKTRYVSY